MEFPNIIVPRSAANAARVQPARLIDAVVQYTDFMLEKVHFSRGEFPEEALWVRHCDFYRSQVVAGGHSAFVRNAMRDLPEILADVGFGLRASRADRFCVLYEQMQTWIARFPKGATTLTGFINGIAPELQALDGPFAELMESDDLEAILARWIIDLECLEVVDDADFVPLLYSAIQRDPRSKRRRASGRIAAIEHILSDPTHLGLGMVATSMQPPEPPTRIGSSRMSTVGPDTVAPSHGMRTIADVRFGVAMEDGFALFEANADGATGKAPPLNVSRRDLDASLTSAPRTLGRRLAMIEPEDAELAGRVCEQLDVAAAIDLLLINLPRPASVTWAAVHKIRRASIGGPEAVVMIVADKATRGFAVVVNQQDANLLSEPAHEVVGSVSREQIDTHLRYAGRA